MLPIGHLEIPLQLGISGLFRMATRLYLPVPIRNILIRQEEDWLQ